MTKRHIYTFGAFQLDAQQRILLREGERIPLCPKTLAMLLALVESGGAVITKDELLTKVWPDTFVGENSLTKNISMLRKTLSDDPDHARYIETIPTIGYRFVVPVREASNSHPMEAEALTLATQEQRMGFKVSALWRRRWFWGLGLAGLLGGFAVATY